MKRLLAFIAVLTIVGNGPVMVTCLSTRPQGPLNKVEAGAVKRFKNYDKLCKTCPTLLQPRIETLEEMIMGLSIAEREGLLENVARRISDQEQGASSIQTAEDVFEFQTGSRVVEHEMPDDTSSTKEERTSVKQKKERLSSKDKILGKMDKTRSKFAKNQVEIARFQRLVDAANEILAAGKTLSNKDTTTTDSTIYHCIDELQNMSRTELKMQRLKYIAQKTKYEQKLAKNRVKLYGASLNLADAKQEKEPVLK